MRSMSLDSEARIKAAISRSFSSCSALISWSQVTSSSPASWPSDSRSFFERRPGRAIATRMVLRAGLPGALDLRPGVAKGHGPIEDERARLRVDRVGNEIRCTLELVARADWIVGYTRLDLRSFHDGQRFAVHELEDVDVARRVWFRHGEQPVVESQRDVEGVRRRDPLDGALHFASVG